MRAKANRTSACNGTDGVIRSQLIRTSTINCDWSDITQTTTNSQIASIDSCRPRVGIYTRKRQCSCSSFGELSCAGDHATKGC